MNVLQSNREQIKFFFTFRGSVFVIPKCKLWKNFTDQLFHTLPVWEVGELRARMFWVHGSHLFIPAAGEGSVPSPQIPLEAAATLDKELKMPLISSRGRIYTEEPEGRTVSHMSICFVSSVTKENVAELTSSSCIHQVFNNFFLEKRVR